ncbi:hypothetical protein [Arthrobacter sp. UYCu712]|uniref:hypothetical protein n=1 Tax=Arthrobacter sp. UYCu712 TaxID=3156340 RepID=UPI00339670AF
MGWVVWSVDTETGAREGIVPLKEGTWACPLDASGLGQGSFFVGDRDSFGMPGDFMTTPVLRTLVFEYDGFPMYAGIIWIRKYDFDASTVHLTYADPNSILGKRLVAPYSSAGMQAAPPLEYGPLSLETQVKRAVQAATAGDMFELPIVLPADMAGVHSRTYYGYHMMKASDVIQDLKEQPYGPDVIFTPRWKPGNPNLFEWVLNIGVPVPGLLVFHVGVKKSGISKLTVTEDANELANHVIATGEGTEAAMLVKSAIHGASEYPALVKTISFPQEKDETVLQALADAELALNKKPVEQWAFNIQAGAEHKLSELRPGLGVRVHVQKNAWLGNGTRNLRLIGVSGSLKPEVTLQFQPMEA